MIFIKYNPVLKKGYVKIDSFDNQELYEELISMGFVYKDKRIQGNAFQLHSLIEDPIDNFTIEKHHKENIIKDSNTYTGVEISRNNVEDSKLIYPPLKDFQRTGIHNLINYSGFILNYDVGCGKTYTTISALNHLINNEIDKILIITVGQVINNWKKEILKFSNLFKEDDFYIANRFNRDPFNSDKKIIIMKYDTFSMILKDKYKQKNKVPPIKSFKNSLLNKDIERWGDRLSIVFDESHKLKNSDSLRYKYIFPSVKLFKKRILLTGTLKPNKWIDIYTQMTLVDPSKHVVKKLSFSDFRKDTCLLGDEYSTVSITGIQEDKVKEYDNIFNNYIQKVKKEELGNLLTKVNTKKVYVELSKQHREIYQAIISQDLYALKQEKGALYTKEVFNRFPYLLLSLADPIMFENRVIGNDLNKLMNNWKIEYNEKYNITCEILKDRIEEENEKCIIWLFNPKVIDILRHKFKKYNPYIIHGQEKPKRGQSVDEYKEIIINDFNTNSKRNLLIANPSCIGEGMNIVGANNVIIWNLTFSYAVIEQFRGRVHRPGQKKDINEWFLIGDNTLDNLAFEIFLNKASLNDVNVDYDILTKYQYKALFEGDYEVFKKLCS